MKQELLDGPVSTQEHIDIADAVAARDAERAALLTRNHIARSRTSIAKIIDAQPVRDPRLDPPSLAARIAARGEESARGDAQMIRRLRNDLMNRELPGLQDRSGHG